MLVMNAEVIMLINRHGLSRNDFFDAKGSPVSHVKATMKKTGAQWAYNSTPCNNGGHTTRSRSGHCIVCRPAGIAFQKRNSVQGNIYIAGSISKRYTKVGMTTEILDMRIHKMNSRNVGETNDWQAIIEIRCSEPNKLELFVHSKLEKYRSLGLYDNMNTENKEIFSCGINKVIEVIHDAMITLNIKETYRHIVVPDLNLFNFRNLRRI